MQTYLTCYQCSRSTSLEFLSFVFCQKSYSKKNYTALCNTCINKDVFICVNKLLNVHARIGDQQHVYVDTRRLIWNWPWMEIYLTENCAYEICQKLNVVFTRPQFHKRGIVDIEVSSPFLAKPPVKSTNCASPPPLLGNPPYILIY